MRTFLGNGTATTVVINEQGPSAAWDQTLVHGGWTHVQRVPGCGLPDLAADEAPEQLVSADVAFPNGFTAKAGVYLNGLFPGPTPSTATFMGTYSDTPGTMSLEFRSVMPGECITVFDTGALVTPLQVQADGYLDQFNDRVVPP